MERNKINGYRFAKDLTLKALDYMFLKSDKEDGLLHKPSSIREIDQMVELTSAILDDKIIQMSKKVKG